MHVHVLPLLLPRRRRGHIQHSTNIPDRQMKVLQGEEHLLMEMALMKNKNPTIFWDMEDGDDIDPFVKPSGTLTFEDVL